MNDKIYVVDSENVCIGERILVEYAIRMIEAGKEVQEIAAKRVEEIIKSLKEQSNLTEEMKNTDQLYWVGMMNNFKNQAEEIVLKELIYV